MEYSDWLDLFQEAFDWLKIAESQESDEILRQSLFMVRFSSAESEASSESRLPVILNSIQMSCEQSQVQSLLTSNLSKLLEWRQKSSDREEELPCRIL